MLARIQITVVALVVVIAGAALAAAPDDPIQVTTLGGSHPTISPDGV